MVKKTTHTILDIEGLMYELLNKIRDTETKEEKRVLIKKLKSLERHYNDCNDKNINGKKYPERMYHSDDKPMNKEEIFKLIDSVPSKPRDEWSNEDESTFWRDEINLSGVLTPDARAEMSDLRS